MHIAARLAVQSPCSHFAGHDGSAPPVGSFHGRNVVVRVLSETGFEAESTDHYPVGALVRIRLPGAGNALARITDAMPGRLSANFVNPVGASRLAMTLGARSEGVAA